MRLLFVKRALAWPRSSGHDVYAYHAMKECAALGHEVSLAFGVAPAPEAVKGLRLANRYPFGGRDRSETFGGRATWLQRRFRSIPKSIRWQSEPSLILAETPRRPVSFQPQAGVRSAISYPDQ